METQATTEELIQKKTKNNFNGVRPTAAFIGAAWASLGIGVIS